MIFDYLFSDGSLQECFHEKDFLNHRYHAKRCLYLHVIEKSLRSSPLIQKISWSTFLDEARKPILHVYPGCSFLFFPIRPIQRIKFDASACTQFLLFLFLSHFSVLYCCSKRNRRTSWVLCQDNTNCKLFVQCFKDEFINKKQCSCIHKR
jgi:hypothetical protein